ncbi:Outer membrane receptor proteins, mostly Fe transport [Tenacibaculum sp. 190130A14a]|uniref:Outer membrane receptor proteins, mostly Fe transport n=1 Tax=Tenacibaculum polynesiense TaxID=3137857 RepID=A0ABM9P744_9FLAO
MNNLLKINVFAFFLVCSVSLFSQNTGVIKGKVIDKKTREVLPFVNITVNEGSVGVSTNDEGMFELTGVVLGYNKIQVSFVGYKTLVTSDYLVTKDKVPFVLVELEQEVATLEEVEVTAKLFQKPLESPLSLQSLGVEEIERNPGGNRDVLKVIQSFPGVASNPGFRNDIIIRGGATSENKFYVDGIEVPVINHFQTQGATGGPVGIINVDLVRKVDFYASAFPANRGNALSSVIEFTQKRGNPNRIQTRATVGTSDAGITIDGPLGEKTNYMLSVRQSYLQFLFKLIKLPFLPTYTDFQLNLNSQLSKNSELSILALGAIDDFEINTEVNDGETDEDIIKKNKVFLNAVPVNTQWNYTVGARYKYFGNVSTHTFVLSRNEWKNKAEKYFLNIETPSNLLLNYESKEIENKFRYENELKTNNDYKITFGGNLETAKYTNATFQKIANVNGVEIDEFSSEVSFLKYGLFGQMSKRYFQNRLGVSLGVRLDGVDYNSNMSNIFNQLSPRLALSYNLNNKWSLNSSIGSYYQLPSYTVLGYRNDQGVLLNQNELKYIRSNHYVTGVEFLPNKTSKVTIEGFYKQYRNYPFSVRDQISLANLGADFGVVGSEEVVSNSEGRAYGFELLAQKKSFNGLYGLLSYTFVRSEFKDVNNTYVPSTWDNRHLLTVTGGKKLNKNWEVGARFRLVGGRPYTPYDESASSLIETYNVRNGGVLDYTRLNQERFSTYTQLDVRVDKTWFLKKWSINLYLDIQNLYASSTEQQAFLLPTENPDGTRVVDPNDSNRYVLEEIENTSGRILPRIGLIMDF